MRLYFISSGVNSERTKKLLSCFCCCHWSFLIDWLIEIELIFFFQSNNSIYWVYIKKMDDIKIDGIYDLIASTTSKLLWESQIVFLIDPASNSYLFRRRTVLYRRGTKAWWGGGLINFQNSTAIINLNAQRFV